MRKENLLLVSLTVIVLLLAFFTPHIGWRLGGVLVRGGADDARDTEILERENLKLKTELAKLRDLERQLPQGPEGGIRAPVLSSYPYNYRNELLVGAGERDGVRKGAAVLYQGFVIGKTDEVLEAVSSVQTILDGGWQSAVRVGEKGIDALLIGGNRPILTYIDKKTPVKEREPVWSAAGEFPYGIPVGEVGAVRPSSDALSEEADLNFLYEVNQIHAVDILQDVSVPAR